MSLDTLPVIDLRIAEFQAHDRPQERLERQGPAALRDAELLAVILRCGTPGSNVLKVSEELLREAGSLARLLSWRSEEFQRIRGIGRVKALQLVSLLEIARRIQQEGLGPSPLLREPESVADFLAPCAKGLEVEKLWVLSLNPRARLIRCTEISSGTATASLVHPREVFREALRLSATAVVVAHNHPSGDPQPSSADIAVTRQLKESARILGIDFLDHVIVGRAEADPAGRGWFSFRTAGLV